MEAPPNVGRAALSTDGRPASGLKAGVEILLVSFREHVFVGEEAVKVPWFSRLLGSVEVRQKDGSSVGRVE